MPFILGRPGLRPPRPGRLRPGGPRALRLAVGQEEDHAARLLLLPQVLQDEALPHQAGPGGRGQLRGQRRGRERDVGGGQGVGVPGEVQAQEAQRLHLLLK